MKDRAAAIPLVEDTTKIEQLFFELASESRMSILSKLSQESMKMQELGRSLNLTATETFRQLQRLTEVQLISKNIDGSYSITPYGRAILFLCPSFEFLLKNRQYFLNHDIMQIPPEFIYRLGELNGGELRTEIPDNLNRVEQIIKSAKEYLWVLSSRVLDAHSRAMVEGCKMGLKFRSLHDWSLITSEAEQSEVERCIERRYIQRTPGIVIITEKEAVISFPFMDGKPDYVAFFGVDPAFRKWVTDFYLYFWEKGETQKKR